MITCISQIPNDTVAGRLLLVALGQLMGAHPHKTPEELLEYLNRISEPIYSDRPINASHDAMPVLTLEEEIKHVINRHSAENGSDTPDYVLASFLASCLKAFDNAVHARSHFYGGHQNIMGMAEPHSNL